MSGLALLAVLLAAPQQPSAADQPLQRAVLEIVVNENTLGDAIVHLGNGDVWVPVDPLARAGLRADIGVRRVINGQMFLSLRSLAPQGTFSLDEAALVVKITAPAEFFGKSVVTLQSYRPENLEYVSQPAVYLNYGVNYRPKGGGSDAAAELAGSFHGLFASTTMNVLSNRRILRGQTQVIADDRRRLRRFTFGDRFVSSGAIGGSALLGGVTVTKDFGIDPYFVRYPTLDFAGAVATASTVEVYVNDRLVNRVQVAPGEFQLRNVPVPNGSGDTRMIIRDAFGGTREIASPFYMTTALLAEGVHDYTYSVGWMREQTHFDNWKYRRLVALGTHRYGLTPSLTLGARGEASGELWNAGPLLNAKLSTAGDVEFGVSAGGKSGNRGYALLSGYRFQGRRLSAGFGANFRSPAYPTMSDLSLLQAKRRFDMNSFVGVLVARALSLTLQQSTTENYPGAFVERRRSRIAASVSTRLTKLFNVFATIGRVDIDRVKSFETSINVTVGLGDRRLGSVTYENGLAGRRLGAEVQQSPPIGEGLGYRIHGDVGTLDRAGAKIVDKTTYGRYEAEHERLNGSGTTTLSAAGALVLMDRHLFASRPIEESFAVLKVPGIAGVQGYTSNQEVGKTGRNGYLLIPNLLPYYGNVLSIAEQDIPMDYAFESARRVVAPPYRGGALVTFATVKRQAVKGSVTLETAREKIVPSYGELTVVVDGKPISSPIGAAGEFYLDQVPPGSYSARVDYHGESCTFTMQVPSSSAPVTSIGSVTCRVP